MSGGEGALGGEHTIPQRPGFQLGYVVTDIERAIADYDNDGPGQVWSIWTYDSAQMGHLGDGAATVTSRWRLALNDADPQIEFIQPIEGENPYTLFLRERPSGGLHHYGLFVHDVAAALRPLRLAGYRICFEGVDHGDSRDGQFVYLEPPRGRTEAFSPRIIELIKPPTRRLKPETIMDLRS